MTKKKVVSLKDKKKNFNKKKKKMLFKTTITIFDDNTTYCEGPIDNPVLMMQIFAAGMNVVTSRNVSLEKLRDDTMGKKTPEAPKVVDHKPTLII